MSSWFDGRLAQHLPGTGEVQYLFRMVSVRCMQAMPRRALIGTLLVLVSLLLASAGCTAPPSAAEVAAATLYFPPEVRRIDEPRFCFSAAERERALQEYRSDGSDTLFECVIDDQGKVKKVRLLRTHVNRVYHQDMLNHARWFVFTPDLKGQGYRAFFLPMKYRFDATFEWIEPG